MQSICNVMRDMNLKTITLDRERYEVACLRQNIIDEYEKKSKELLNYLNLMEVELDLQHHEFEQREAFLRQENELLKSKLDRRLHGSKPEDLTNVHVRPFGSPAVGSEPDVERAQEKWDCPREQKRSQELRTYVNDLQLELHKMGEMMLRQKKGLEQSRRQMECENQELRRKVALGWMLGCLSELYARVDLKSKGAQIMDLIKKVKQELEAGSCIFNEKDLFLKAGNEATRDGVHQSIEHCHPFCATPLQNPATNCHSFLKTLTSRVLKPCSENESFQHPKRSRKQWQNHYVLDLNRNEQVEYKKSITDSILSIL